MNFKQESFKFILGILLIFTFWFVLSEILQRSLLPGPFETISYLMVNLWQKNLYIDLMISFKRVLIALVSSFLIGFPIGIITGVNKRAEIILNPIIYFFYPLPKIVFLPLFFIFLGINEITRISLLFFILIFQVIVSVRDSVKKISPEYIELFKTMGAGRLDYLKLYVPFAAPGAFSSLRISVGMAIAVLFITENFVADRGLGYVILNAMELRNYLEMYSGIILMGVLGYFFYFSIDFLEIKVCFWQKSMLE